MDEHLALAVEFCEDHSELQPAPVAVPAGMVYCTLYFEECSHTFIGGPDQVHSWLLLQKNFRNIDEFLIVFRILDNGDIWGESYDPNQTTFLPEKHYIFHGSRREITIPPPAVAQT